MDMMSEAEFNGGADSLQLSPAAAQGTDAQAQSAKRTTAAEHVNENVEDQSFSFSSDLTLENM